MGEQKAVDSTYIYRAFKCVSDSLIISMIGRIQDFWLIQKIRIMSIA